jgi:hypothetical protein
MPSCGGADLSGVDLRDVPHLEQYPSDGNATIARESSDIKNIFMSQVTAFIFHALNVDSPGFDDLGTRR